jgi:hypothetical protein
MAAGKGFTICRPEALRRGRSKMLQRIVKIARRQCKLTLFHLFQIAILYCTGTTLCRLMSITAIQQIQKLRQLVLLVQASS